jgi:hypothetical protein
MVPQIEPTASVVLIGRLRVPQQVLGREQDGVSAKIRHDSHLTEMGITTTRSNFEGMFP